MLDGDGTRHAKSGLFWLVVTSSEGCVPVTRAQTLIRDLMRAYQTLSLSEQDLLLPILEGRFGLLALYCCKAKERVLFSNILCFQEFFRGSSLF